MAATVHDLPPTEDPAASQTVRAQARLRELIVSGELAPGARIPELTLVERLGVSRTPVRAALLRLQEEGLLEALPGGGFVVREFGEADIHDAIELRGTLEGLAARLAAERGCGAVVLAGLRDCLDRIDELLAREAIDDESFAGYAAHNGRFHRLLAEAAGSPTIRRQIERVVTLPFASPNGFVRVGAGAPAARDTLVIAQAQHHAVVEAIVQREGARAESLMREHARIARGKLDEALATQQGLQSLPGAGLIRRAGR
ncbi:GntR family transcriptional regulator [Aquincola sp. S2]|uniref:GntR family transcriptional regulator n=1 Tax=Pseudaquabacterium terrae TaxID=2732868 RepID=A0ABX2EPA4_9BURK|nr:GntR family transcriptional regulator [Aquabacterium terrae]NRF70376.1 GntR family transcriptional regulator [Aquabacterium terrae]